MALYVIVPEPTSFFLWRTDDVLAHHNLGVRLPIQTLDLELMNYG